MSVEKVESLLKPDIADILKSYYPITYSSSFVIEAKLHTELKDLTTGDGILLSSIYILRDYINNISDHIEAKLLVPLGTFLYDIYDHLDNIEVTLITEKQLYQGKKPYKEKERYKAVYLLDKNLGIPNSINQSKADLNNRPPITITLQLIDRSAETLRIKTTQGNFDRKLNGNGDMSIFCFIKSIISEQANKILIENKPSLDMILIEPPDNKEDLKAITLPSYTRIIEIPDYLQTKNIGVYNAGIGSYIQKFGLDHFTYKKIFYTYSLYDPQKYKNSEYKIIFYSPTTSSASITDITYKYKDKILKILPHDITNLDDNKESIVMSTGSGLRTSNANSYMKKPVIITVPGPIFSKTKLVTEMIFKHRKDNLQFAPNYKTSTNHFDDTSDVLMKNGKYITIVCSNFDYDFIYPGAPCKILHENKNNEIREIYGVIHRAVIVYGNNNQILPLQYNSKVMTLTSTITLDIFCQLG